MRNAPSPRRTTGGARRSVGVLLVAVLLAACGHSDDAGNAAAARLLDQARQAMQKEDWETAFRRAKQVHTEYPDSASDVDAYTTATYCLVRLYFLHHHDATPSVWLGSEQDYAFEWMAGFFDDPERAAMSAKHMFVGAPYNRFRVFQAWSADHPVFSRWTITAEDDDGIIQSVTVTPRGAGDGAPPA